jgi:hypothetical protein
MKNIKLTDDRSSSRARIREFYQARENSDLPDEEVLIDVDHLIEYYNLLRKCLPKIASCETRKEQRLALTKVKAPLKDLSINQDLEDASKGFFHLSLCQDIQDYLDDLNDQFQTGLRETLEYESDPTLIAFDLIEQAVLLDLERLLHSKREQMYFDKLKVYIETEDFEAKVPRRVHPAKVKATFLTANNCLETLSQTKRDKK